MPTTVNANSMADFILSAAPEILRNGLNPGPGFVIESEGKPVEWIEDTSVYLPNQIRQVEWKDKNSELRVSCAVALRGGRAAILRTTLINPDAKSSVPLSKIKPLQLTWPKGMTGRVRMRNLNGGVTSPFYPPESLRVRTAERRYGGGPESFRIESHPGGGSSNRHMPFLFVTCDEAGLIASMEWSGRWALECVWDWDNDILKLEADIPVNGLVLDPGERLELPAVHLVFSERCELAGCTNALRRYLRDEICPLFGGRPVVPPLVYNTWFGVTLNFDEDFLKKQMEAAAEVGLEGFTIDAGWSGAVNENDWGNGNYERIDEKKFPSGIELTARRSRKHGMPLGLWWDPEHAGKESDLFKTHPDWFIDDSSHLDFTNPAVGEYFERVIGDRIEKLNLGWIKWDYNIVFEQFKIWDKHDPTGKYPFYYQKELYGLWDRLIAKYPKTIFEQCAGGGRRIDLANLRRSHTYWFSDFTWETDICRAMQANLNLIVPGHICSTALHTVKGSTEPGLSDYDFISRMHGPVQFMGDIAIWPPALRRRVKKLVKIFKSYRHLLGQDYYQLTPPPAQPDDGQVSQFVDYKGLETVILAFPERPARERKLHLCGLQPKREYELHDPVHRIDLGRKTGRQLMEKGLNLKKHKGPFALILGKAVRGK